MVYRCKLYIRDIWFVICMYWLIKLKGFLFMNLINDNIGICCIFRYFVFVLMLYVENVYFKIFYLDENYWVW